jgi:parallel beta-helix repeat protein
MDRSFDRLDAALASARDGDTIEIAGGTHTGNFVVDRSIVLRGRASGPELPVLDGGGTGTVLTVKASGAVIENLALEHSGRDPNPWALWGDAGVLVTADEVTLRGLRITDNDWGIVFHAGTASLIERSVVEDNVRHGIKVMAGRNHRVLGNSINRNAVGISIDALFGEQRESPLAHLGDPDALRILALQKEISLRSRDIVVAANEVRGNASYGIEIAWESERITVEENHVHKTGVERLVDWEMIAAWEKTVSEGAGVPVTLDRSAYGSGIFLFCLVKDSSVASNRSHDNAAAGIGLNLVNRNRIIANAIENNRVGISVSTSNENRFERNIVHANAEYGIRIAVAAPAAASSADNLLTLNDMSANGVNALDSSGGTPSAEDIDKIIDTMPFPDAVKDQLRTNRQLRDAMLKTYLEHIEPASNRWDDSTYGNRHDDFDEVAEGFVDDNDDGVGERTHPIPGGTAVDHFPVTPERLSRMRAEAQP